MASPPLSGSLGRLPGKDYDKTPRLLRESFLNGGVVPEQFLEQNIKGLPKSADARLDNQIKSYATASIVIDQFWKYVQRQPFGLILAELKSKRGSGVHDERVRNFLAITLALLNNARDRFVKEAKERSKAKQEMSLEDQFLLCFWSVARKRHRHLKGLPFPSMNDLIVFFGRLVQVAPTVFLRDVGRELSERELFDLLRHPYMLRLCVGIMSNDRKSTHPLFAKLEGAEKGDLNDIDRKFGPQYFEIHEENGSRSMRIKPTVMSEYCSHFAKAAVRREKRNKAPIKVLGCPALYTGQFREMYEWLCKQFEDWYITPKAAPK